MKYFSPHKEMWTSCVHMCVCVCRYVSSCVYVILRLPPNGLLHFCPFVWFSLLQSLLAWKLWSVFIFHFSSVEQGMAEATPTNIPEEKTDGSAISSYTQAVVWATDTSKGLGFCFAKIPLLQGKSPSGMALWRSSFVSV